VNGVPWRCAVRRVRQRADALRLLVAALLLAACLLHPGRVVERARFEHVVVIDITQSMNVPDETLAGQPASRLAFARERLRDALLELPCGSKLGWGVFTEYRSYLLLAPVEVCAHLDELRATLAHIDGRMAWSGNSEIAKGVHSGIGIVRQLPGNPTLVFITDGHESPPLSASHRPAFDDKPGDASGIIVGVGGLLPAPIPKTDPQGQPLGFWRADDVMQTDPYSEGRGGSVNGERMSDDATAPRSSAALGATPGTEHLSALHEGYLRLLAGELGLAFHRLAEAEPFVAALTAPALARPMPVRLDLRAGFAALALVLVLAPHVGWGISRWRAWWLARQGGAAGAKIARSNA
jgi:mxaL protein